MKARIILLPILIFLISVVFVETVGAKEIETPVTLKSPDGQVALSFELKDVGELKNCPTYSASFNGKPIVAESCLGFDLNDGTKLSDNFRIVSSDRSSHNSTWKPVYGDRNTVRDHYNQLHIQLIQKDPSSQGLELIFRCYDSGVAFCYTIPKSGSRDKISIKKENTEFGFHKNHSAWYTASAQGVYEKRPIQDMHNAERPLMMQAEEEVYVAIAEAKLVDYARMKLSTQQGKTNCLVSSLGSTVQGALPLTTPWRVIMMASSPGKLLESNDLILNLNDPCAIEDTSWIKPGKVLREVTLTTVGGKACIDFAVKHHIDYVEFDAGWYGPEKNPKSDASTVTLDPRRSAGPLNLPEVIRYAKERNIGIILYVNRFALQKQLDEILPIYKEWGIKGLKYGFVNVGSQEWTSWLHDAVRKAAKHKLMVDIHDEYRPTGYSRTYPNLMTQEGIRGDEASPNTSQTLTTIFTRMLAGAGDHTICYYDPRVDRLSSHAYQLAKAVCFYSP